MAVTILDIAKASGKSYPTVSRALNNHPKISTKTKAEIKQIAEKLGYRPNLAARRLVGKNSRIIGLVMDTCAPKIYHDRLSKMELYAAERGYRFMLGQAHNDIKKIKEYAEYFTAYGVDGLICMAHNYPDASRKIAEFFLKKNKTTFFEAPERVSDACSVTIDLADNFYQAVRYLVQNGRKQIGFFRLEDFYVNSTMNICQSGYQNGLKETGVSFIQELVCGVPVSEMKSADAWLPLIKKLIKNKTDAIICVNDYIAAITIKGLAKLKIKVPDDIAVIGCDNLDIATLITPELTTFEQHNDQVAVHLVDQIINLIENKTILPEEKQIVVKPTMIFRESA